MPTHTQQPAPLTPAARGALAGAAVAAVLLGGVWLTRVAMPLPPGTGSAPGQADVFPEPPRGEMLAAQEGDEAVTYHFSTPLRPGEVLQYYRVAMNELGWRLLDLGEADLEEDILAFSRGSQTCIMRVSEFSPGGETSVTAVIQLRPAPSPLRAPYEQPAPRPTE